MRGKNLLNIKTSLLTLSNLYKSGVSEKDLLVVKSFLILLRKENFLILDNYKDALDHRITLNKIVYSISSDEIKELYKDHIEQICCSIRKLFFNELINIYADISEEFINDNVRVFFDDEVETALTRKVLEGVDAMQPSEITILLNSFCDKQNIKSYYNPFAGLASLSLDLPRHISYFGEENNKETWLLGRLRMMVYGCPLNFNYKLTNSLEEWSSDPDRKYDFISYNPPFNIKLDENSVSDYLINNLFGYRGNSNSLILSEIIKLLKPEGTMAFICPNAFLFSSNQRDKALKKYLTHEGYVEKIIALPEHILSFTALSVNVVVIKNVKRSNVDIEFIDATELVDKEYSKLHRIKLVETLQLISDKSNRLKRYVGLEELKSNDYNLSVNRYVYEDLGISDEDIELLDKLKNLVSPVLKSKVEKDNGKLIRIRDLTQDSISFVKSFEGLDTFVLKSYANKLETDTLLLATAWKSLKPTLYQGNESNLYYDYNAIFACQIKEKKVDKDYLILELSKDYVQKQIDQKRSGSVQSRITRKDLLEIEIILPTLEVQKKRKYNFQESIINEQQNKVKELIHEYGIDVADENSFLRHKIAGTLKNLRGSFSKLKNIIDNQVANKLPEVYSLKVDERLDSNFSDYLKRIERDLNSILGSVQAVGVELNLNEKKLKSIEFLKFVKNYVEGVQSRKSLEFNISLSYDRETLKEHKIKEINLNGNSELLHQVFDNILENAERHAFIHDRNNIVEVYIRFDLSRMNVTVEFANNGIELPKDFTMGKFLRKGSKSSLKGGKGIGGWMIHEIVKKHNGNLSITNYNHEYVDSYQEIKTGILLTFPFELKI
jgi:type I restriction enzyme M protein